MAERMVDALSDAVGATEKDIFLEAIDGKAPEPSDGDRSAEAMGTGLEGQLEADDAEGDEADEIKDEPVEAKDGQERDDKGRFAEKSEPETKGKQETKDAGEEPPARVPSSRLREETERARQAEDRAKQAEDRATAIEAQRQADIAAFNARLDGILQAQRNVPQPKPEPKAVPQRPDIFTDPDGWQRWADDRRADEMQSLRQDYDTRILNMSLAAAHEAHGERFEKAYAALTAGDPRDPGRQAMVTRITSAPNPGSALMRWWGEQETIREVGPDPSKYRERIETETRQSLMKDPEFRKAMLEHLRGEASANGNSRVKLPPSLNGSSGGSNANARESIDGSERGIFDAAWNS